MNAAIGTLYNSEEEYDFEKLTAFDSAIDFTYYNQLSQERVELESDNSTVKTIERTLSSKNKGLVPKKHHSEIPISDLKETRTHVVNTDP